MSVIASAGQLSATDLDPLSVAVAGADLSDIPSDVQGCVRSGLADLVSVAVGAHAISSSLIDTYASFLQAGPATVLGLGRCTTPHYAPLLNGVLGHHTELDDGHLTSHTHPGVTVIPAALAAAEEAGASMAELVTAVALGYEVAIRVGLAISKVAMQGMRLHMPAIAGSLGATAAAARILGLDRQQVVSAIGCGGSLTPIAPLEAFSSGSGTKDMYGGWPAFVGYTAATLARSGLTGPPGVLSGPSGLLQAFSSDRAELFADIGTRWHTRDIYRKPYAACSLSFTTIDALLSVRSEVRTRREEIVSIEVETFDLAASLSDPAPSTPQGAKYSIPFLLATALLDGTVASGSFTAAALTGSERRLIARKVHLSEAADLSERHNRNPARRPSRLRVVFSNGDVVEAAEDRPRGGPERPLKAFELKQKYDAQFAGLPPHAGDRLWSLIVDGSDDLPVVQLLDAVPVMPARAKDDGRG